MRVREMEGEPRNVSSTPLLHPIAALLSYGAEFGDVLPQISRFLGGPEPIGGTFRTTR